MTVCDSNSFPLEYSKWQAIMKSRLNTRGKAHLANVKHHMQSLSQHLDGDHIRGVQLEIQLLNVKLKIVDLRNERIEWLLKH